MILIRNIFQIKFGRMKEALELWKEGETIAKAVGHERNRATTDLSGDFYVLVVENTYANLADYEKANAQMSLNQNWRAWYQKLLPLVDSGRREFYTVIE